MVSLLGWNWSRTSIAHISNLDISYYSCRVTNVNVKVLPTHRIGKSLD